MYGPSMANSSLGVGIYTAERIRSLLMEGMLGYFNGARGVSYQ